MNKIGCASYALRDKINDPEIGWERVADFLAEQKVDFIEINNVFVDDSQPGFQKVVDIFESRGLEPLQLTIDGNNFFQ